MKDVAKFYQIAVVINDTDKRMMAVVKNESGKSIPVLDVSGEEAVAKYNALVDLLENSPTKN